MRKWGKFPLTCAQVGEIPMIYAQVGKLPPEYVHLVQLRTVLLCLVVLHACCGHGSMCPRLVTIGIASPWQASVGCYHRPRVYDYGIVTAGVPFDVPMFIADSSGQPVVGARVRLDANGLPDQVPFAISSLQYTVDEVHWSFGLPGSPFMTATLPPTGLCLDRKGATCFWRETLPLHVFSYT
jgi:hypothetical protein